MSVADAADVNASSSTATQKPAGVPFTCYRCGEPLTGSLEDYSHPCLSNVEHIKHKPVTERRDPLGEGLLAEHDPRGPTLTKGQLVGPSTGQDAITATPGGIPRGDRDGPRPLEEVRADLAKRGLPQTSSSADVSGPSSKRRRLSTDDTSKAPVHDATILEDRPRTRASPTRPRATGAFDAQDALTADIPGTTSIEERPPLMKQAVLPSVARTWGSTVVAEKQEDTAEKQDVSPTNDQHTAEVEGDIVNDLQAHAAHVARRRSSRGATQAAAKAAASLAYQQRHKAKIAREIQRCVTQPITALHSGSPTHRTTLSGKTNDDTFDDHPKVSRTAELYEVEIVRAFRHNHCGELEYLVIWKGYPASDATWEPAANLADLEPELFAFTPPVSTHGGCTDGPSIRPTVRGNGELNRPCCRCQGRGCGARRLVKKAESTRHSPQQQEAKRDAHGSSICAEPAASGYSGSDSWPVELLGPKPHPPYCGRFTAAASNVAPAPQSRNKHQDSSPTVTSQPPDIDTIVGEAHLAENGGTEMPATASKPRKLPLNNPPAVAVQSLRDLGPCEHLEKGKLPAGWCACNFCRSRDLTEAVI